MKSCLILMILGFAIMMGMVSAGDEYFHRADPAKRVVKRDDVDEGGAGVYGKRAFGRVVSSNITPFVLMLTGE